MKKFILIALLFLFPQTIFAQGYYFSYEGRASFFTEQDLITELPDGLDADLDNSYSQKFGGGFYFGDGFDLAIFYARTKSQSNNAKPNLIGATTYRNKDIDLELGYNFKIKDVKLRVMGGLRHKNAQQTITNTYFLSEVFDEDGDIIEPHITEDILETYIQKMNGFGPRLGLSVVKDIGGTNFSVTGAVNWSMSFLKRHEHDLANLTENEYASNLASADDHDVEHTHDLITTEKFIPYEEFARYDSKAYSLDLEAGLQYDWKLTKTASLLLNMGYRYDIQYNIISAFLPTLDGKSDFDNTYYFNENVINHGPFFRGTLRF